MKQFLMVLLTQGETNSRFVYLVQGVAITLCLMALSVGFFFAKDKSVFPSMVIALCGGHGVAAFGRFFTKWGDGKQGDSNSDTQVNGNSSNGS